MGVMNTNYPDPTTGNHADDVGDPTTRRAFTAFVVGAIVLAAIGGGGLWIASRSTPESSRAAADPAFPLDQPPAGDGGAPSGGTIDGNSIDTGARPGPVAKAVAGEVEVFVGAGSIELRDTDIVVGDDGRIDPSTTGTATLELPTTGALANAFVDRPLRGRIGVALGSELEALGAHLRPDQQYLYADLGRQEFNLFLDLDDDHAGAQGLPERISTGGISTGSVVLVVDVTGDYLYLSTPCPAMIPAGSGSTPRPAAQRASEYADHDASEIPGVSVDLSGFDPDGCGIGWSTAGVVPFEPILGQRLIEIPDDFGAHVVVDGTVPLSAGLSLDGEMFYRFLDDRAMMWANGELDVGVSFLKGAAEVQLPAVRGTFGAEVTSRNLDLWVTATAGSSASDGSPSELLTDLAPIRGQVDLDGELHVADGDILATSFLQLTGDMSIAPTPVRFDTEIEVVDILAAEALVRIDSTGVMARGKVQASPVPALGLGTSAELEFLVPFADPANSYLQVRGEMTLGDTDLGADAELRIDRNGALARGTVDLAGLGGLDVEGWVGPDGFQLTGAVQATLPIGDLDRVAAKIIDETDNDVVIDTLNRQIDERINQIGSADPAKGTELRNTVNDMRKAFDDIRAVRATIAYNDGLIANLWKQHQADIDWHWALNDFDRFWDTGPHGIRLAAIVAQIEALKFANTVQYGYIDVANTVVSATQQTVLAIIGWDGQLNALLSAPDRGPCLHPGR